MKNALVRLLAFATLATSLSAFATAGEAKHRDAANVSANQQQSGCPTASQDGKKQKKEKKQQDESQQEKDFDRLLMGTHG